MQWKSTDLTNISNDLLGSYSRIIEMDYIDIDG